MKNRRLNVLFIAIIALAAAPQALLDARQWANAAQERAETEFWSVFLSYQTPDAGGARAKSSTELVAMRRTGANSGCPLERIAAPAVNAPRNAEGAKDSTPAKAARETRRASAAMRPAASQPVQQDPGDETIASAEPARTFEFSEAEKKALRGAALHQRETERLSNIASETDIASSLPGNENIQIRMKRALDFDKLLRQRVRYDRERNEANDEIPTQSPIGSM